MKIHIETYGCAANQSNSEIMAGILKNAGHKLVDKEDSDIIIVNTCTVKGTTEKKVLNEIRVLGKTDKIVIVAGCMGEVQLDDIKIANKSAHVIGINMVAKIDKVIDAIITNPDKTAEAFDDKVTDLANIPKLRFNPNINIVQVSQGCDNNCSYCIVRTAKGHLVSFDPRNILTDIEDSVKSGCSEIWLTSQDMAAYGTDSGTLLPALLPKISVIPGDFKVRIGMMNPSSVLPILDDLVKAFKNDKIFKFLHLPIQSGSDKVLKDMNRHYTVSDVKKILAGFKKEIPDITFATDIIAGYPTEKDEDFTKTKEFLKEKMPDMINISGYTPRPMTTAKRLKNIASETIKFRTSRISAVAEMVKTKKNRAWIGWEGDALIEEKTGNGVLARNFAYKPIVIKDEKLKLGRTVKIKITESAEGYLFGEVV